MEWKPLFMDWESREVFLHSPATGTSGGLLFVDVGGIALILSSNAMMGALSEAAETVEATWFKSRIWSNSVLLSTTAAPAAAAVLTDRSSSNSERFSRSPPLTTLEGESTMVIWRYLDMQVSNLVLVVLTAEDEEGYLY